MRVLKGDGPLSPAPAVVDLDPPARTLTVSGTVVGAVGRMDAVAAIYDEVHAELFGYAASLVRDASAAEDLMHEAFARLVREGTTGRWPDDPRAWLYRVCTNLAISGSRRRAVAGRWNQLVGRTGDVFGGAHADEAAEAAEVTVIRRERHDELERALLTLPTESRAALLLAAEGFTGREVATILGRSEGATRSLMWRARLSMKDRMQELEHPDGRGEEARR